MTATINASTSSGIVQTADTSGELALQSNGTTKLTVSSSGVNIGQMNGGAITSGTAQASTSGTSLTFSGIPSWAKRITVMFNNIATSASAPVVIQLGTSGGIVTTGYAGSSGTIRSGAVSSGITQTNSSYFNLYAEVSTLGEAYSGSITICNINSNTWTENGVLASNNSLRIGCSGGYVALGGVLTQLKITTTTGTDTFTNGLVNILYEG